MKLRFYLVITSSLLFCSWVSAQTDPVIQNIINQVDISSLNTFINDLSGEVQTNVGGNIVRISSRNAFASDNDTAALYLINKLAGYGLDVFEQNYDSNGKNIFAVQTGSIYPEKQYIICAHYDSMPTGLISPGADDNGSGTAAVLEAARILSAFTPKHTIIYALWDEEEYGLYGSDYYADLANSSDDEILGVINLDMIAWDENNDMHCELHTKNIGGSIAFANTIIDINDLYGIGIDIGIVNPGTGASDHASFWANGFTAILLIEDYYGGDFNNYYHSQNDLIDHFNTAYFLRMTKLSIAALAHFAQIEGSTPVELISFGYSILDQNVVLNWSTATESNNYGFELERSENQIIWDNIGFVKGNSNSNEVLNYTFSDIDPITGKSYYRLIQMDFNGDTEILGPIDVEYRIPDKFVLDQNYPNPFNPNTVIGFNLPYPSHVKLEVHNILGQLIEILIDDYLDAGYHKVVLDIYKNVTPLPSGVYFYKINADGFTEVRKMIISK